MDNKLHLSKCEYYLREPGDGLSDADFEKIRTAAAEWSQNEGIVCYLEKTRDGFNAAFLLPEDEEEAYCMSFYLHLTTDTFLHLENRGLWMSHHDD